MIRRGAVSMRSRAVTALLVVVLLAGGTWGHPGDGPACGDTSPPSGPLRTS